MKTFIVDLYEYFKLPRGENAGGKLTVLLHENSPEINVERKYPAMLVLPGGGYAFCSDREAEPIAEAYYAEGFNAYILRYSVAPVSVYPTQLCEAAMAMAYIRREAKAQFTDPAHVAAIGFSAGGHLCGSIATMYAREPVKDLGISPVEARTDAAVLSYAVISHGINDVGTAGSLKNLTAG
ncbi:MAG: alpha/beta hydrolase, partial [Clostridia bacterium]|nr:alpha/beta hydrolase [Clostridia bacterium]